MKLLILILLLTTTTAQAYRPTLESLFRQGSNLEVIDKTVAVNLNILHTKTQKEEIESSVEATSPEAAAEEPTTNSLTEHLEELQKNYALKLFFYNTDQKVMQIEYVNAVQANRNITQFKEYSNDFTQTFSKVGDDQKVFFAVLNVLLNNNAKLMIETLKSFGAPVLSNEELINKDKKELLTKYKEYLVAVKEDKDNPELKNPLRPEDEEEIVKVKEVMKQGFYNEDQLVKRVKRGRYFTWQVDHESLLVRFNNSNLLRELKFSTPTGEYHILCGTYRTFKSGMKFPQKVSIKTPGGDEFEISAKNVFALGDKPDAMSIRRKRYTKHQAKNKFEEEITRLDILI